MQNGFGKVIYYITLFNLKTFYYGKHLVHHRGDIGSYLGNFIPRWFFYRRDNSYSAGYCGYNDHFEISKPGRINESNGLMFPNPIDTC